MKSNQMVQPTISADGAKVTFTLNDGGAPMVLHMAKLHSDIIRRAACVGMAQVRIIDAAAISATDSTGRVRSKAERMELKRKAMQALIDHYESGTSDWNRPRASGGRPAIVESDVLLAIQRVYQNSPERAEATITATMAKRGLDRKDAIALWAKTDKIAAEMVEIRAERDRARALTAPEADDLMLELMGEDAGDEDAGEDAE